jgi:hypothetical protein
MEGGQAESEMKASSRVVSMLSPIISTLVVDVDLDVVYL